MESIDKDSGPLELAALTARVEALEREVARLREFAPEQVEEAPARLVFAPVARELAPPPRLTEARAEKKAESLENRLGAQVFSRVGIIAVLVGATYFLKWAIDNHWIGPLGRVLIGLLAGAGLIVWSERFRAKGFGAFSYTLKAIGSGVLYLSLWAAFQLYHLLPAGVALAAMVLVTAWNAWMAWAQDAELLAAYALVGGVLSPVLLSSGGNHEVFLFTYLAAIDLATVVLVRLKPWPRLLLPALGATVAYFIGWYVNFFVPTLAEAQGQLGVTVVFIAVFAALFAVASIQAHAEASKQRYGAVILDVFVPLGNAVFAALALYSVLQDSGHHALLPWAAVVLAGAYLGLTRVQKTAAAGAVHLSLAVVFLTIAIPLKATGRWITVGWLAEGTALLWASRRLEPGESLRALRALAVGALTLGFCGLVSLPFWLFGEVPTAFVNQRFATALVGIAAFGICAWIANNGEASEFWEKTAIGGVLMFNLVAVQAGVTEIATFWHGSSGPDRMLQSHLSLSGFLAAYGAGLLAVGFWKRSAFLRWQGLVLLVFTIGKVFLYDIGGLSQGYRVASFIGLGALLLAVSFVYQKNLLGLRGEAASEPGQGDA